jgi:hypothetical protein
MMAADTAQPPSITHIPAPFWKYHSIFNEKASHRLPKHQPWDHAIDLKADTPMKKKYLYHLTPAETLALTEYIMEHL